MDNAKKIRVLKQFRYVGFAEGTSYLILLFIAMPLKYTMDMPLAVTYVGWIHGILFIVYIYAVFPTKNTLKWTFRRSLMALIASILPFGPFLFDRKLRQQEKEIATESL